MQLGQIQDQIIFKCLAGSRAYGTYTDKSDYDYRGIFTIPADSYLLLNAPPEQVSSSTNDEMYYTVLRFLRLACQGNPNIVEMLFSPSDCVLITSPQWERIRSVRHLFITKHSLGQFIGYAVAQIKRAKGKNKLVNNPMPEKRPTKEDFCWVVPMLVDVNPIGGKNVYQPREYTHVVARNGPFRPVRLSETDIDLSLCVCTAVDHAINTYRIYHTGTNASGVFRRDDTADIVTSPITVNEEYNTYCGVLIYNREAYERELKLWTKYWDWINNRNDARWVDQESGKLDYDSKHMSHCLRLLYESENILETGELIVRFTGDRLQRLRDVREGKVSYDEILEEAEERVKYVDDQRQKCDLPPAIDLEAISKLSVELHSSSIG